MIFFHKESKSKKKIHFFLGGLGEGVGRLGAGWGVGWVVDG